MLILHYDIWNCFHIMKTVSIVLSFKMMHNGGYPLPMYPCLFLRCSYVRLIICWSCFLFPANKKYISSDIHLYGRKLNFVIANFHQDSHKCKTKILSHKLFNRNHKTEIAIFDCALPIQRRLEFTMTWPTFLLYIHLLEATHRVRIVNYKEALPSQPRLSYYRQTYRKYQCAP